MEKKIYKQPEIKTVELKEKLLEGVSGEDNLDADAKKSSFKKEWEEEDNSFSE